MFPSLATLTHAGVAVPIFGTIMLGLALSMYLRCAKRQSWRSVVLNTATFVAVVGLCTTTLAREEGTLTFDLGGAMVWSAGGVQRFISGIGFDDEISLNVALFVPAGILLTVKFQRPTIIMVLLFALSCSIEISQGILSRGNPDASDLIANAMGGILGVAAGCLALRVAGVRGWEITLTAVLVVIGFAVAFCAAPAIANGHQHRVMGDLQEQFRGTSLVDYRRWDQSEQLGSRVFRFEDTYSDGAAARGGEAWVRYPTSVLAHRQCVYGVWSSTGFQVRPMRGTSCSAFLG